jgi:two-component system, LytTR family, response regulator
MNKTFSILIVDDEVSNIEFMTKSFELVELPYTFNLYTADSVENAVLSIEEFNQDILFLDVQLADGEGFDILERINSPAPVVFVTAHEKYALKAFQVDAIGYLLKPISISDLEKFLLKAIKEIEISKPVIDNSIDIENKKLKISSMTGFDLISINDIVYCLADGSYTTIVLKNKTSIVVSKNLSHIEGSLKTFNFFRIHHNTLINLDLVLKYSKSKSGVVTMYDNVELSISKRRVKEFKEVFDLYKA